MFSVEKPFIFLIAICLQTIANSSLIEWSRHRSGPKYSITSAVLMIELVKLILSCIAEVFQYGFSSRIFMLNSWKKSWILMIPAALYSLTNWLAFKSLTYLDASDFQLLAQGKVLSNAGFAVLMLGVKLNKIQWAALSILAFGLALSELSKRSQIEHAHSKQNWTESHDQKWIGSLFVGVIVLVNGFIGTFHEKYIKDLNSTSIFVINAQLAFFSMIVLLAFSVGSSFHEQLDQDFFAGFDALVWLIIFLGSVGGMIVSVIMRHFSNLLKTIAVSLALCGTVAVQTYFSVSSLSASWILSALVVVGAAYIFFESDTTKKKISPDVSDV